MLVVMSMSIIVVHSGIAPASAVVVSVTVSVADVGIYWVVVTVPARCSRCPGTVRAVVTIRASAMNVTLHAAI
jgi:hypothetical protein